MEYPKCENADGQMAMAMHADSIGETSTVGLDPSAFNEVGPERDIGAGAVIPEGTYQTKHLELTDRSVNDDPETTIRTTDSPISLNVLWGNIGAMTTIWYLSRNMSELEYPIYMNFVFVWIPIVLMLFAIRVGLDIGGSADDKKFNRASLETEGRC